MSVKHTWLRLKDAQKLGVSLSTLKLKCSTGQYVSRKVPSRGKTGYTYEVALFSLPEDCKRRYLSQINPIQITSAPAPDPGIEASLISEMSNWEKNYINRFLVFYDFAKGIKGSKLKCFLHEWNKTHPDYSWTYGSFMRVKKKYEDAGNSVNAIRPSWGKRSSTVSDEWLQLFETEYLNQRQPSAFSCWKNVVGAIKRNNPEIDINKIPSHSSFLRKLKTKYSESVICFMRYGLAKWKARYGYSISRHYNDLLCGEVWVSDHVQSDVMVKTPDGKTHFLWITVWLDAKSQKWLGWDIHVEAPNSEHIFSAFYRAAKRWGIPTDVIIDNGKDYRSKTLSGGRQVRDWIKIKVSETECVSLFADLKISVHFAWPYNPESKICERTFGRINSNFARHCNGYRGPDIKQRPDTLKDELKRNQIWSFDTFVKSFDRYIVEVYNRDVVNGQVHQGRSPDELFDNELPIAIKEGRVYQVSSEALKMFCSPLSNPIRIRKSVVEDTKLAVRYYAPWMVSENGTKVRMRRDRADYSVAYFWEDETGRYLGIAELDGNVSAMARSPIEKSELEEKIRRKRFVEKSVRKIAKTISKTDNDEFLENRIAGVTALNEARGFIQNKKQSSESYVITAMDRVITENKRRKKNSYNFTDDAIIDEDDTNKNDIDIDLWGTNNVVNF